MPRGRKASPRTQPHALIGGELPAEGSMYRKLSLADQRKVQRWIKDQKYESELYCKSLDLR